MRFFEKGHADSKYELKDKLKVVLWTQGRILLEIFSS